MPFYVRELRYQQLREERAPLKKNRIKAVGGL